jgi:hypothetical protein
MKIYKTRERLRLAIGAAMRAQGTNYTSLGYDGDLTHYYIKAYINVT